MLHKGRDVIAIPMEYYDEFRRDPVDSLLKYGSMPQRARAPWFTNVETLDRAMTLPDLVTGPGAERIGQLEYKSLIAAAPAQDPYALLKGISENFAATEAAFWHVHVDLALNKKRHGDAAGIAMGRVVEDWLERPTNESGLSYERIVRTYTCPLVAQIAAPHGDQIYIGAIVNLILQLKFERGFNITSFSFDGFQSADASQQLTQAGLVTAGMRVDEFTGEISGLPKPFSVDRSPQPYREVLEAVNEERVTLPAYALLKKELREIEVVDQGRAPDHPIGGSKDVADPVAGVLGYLAAFGHTVLQDPNHGRIFDREDLAEQYGAEAVEAPVPFGVDDDEAWNFDPGEAVSFGVD